MERDGITDEQLRRLYRQHYDYLVRMTYIFLRDHSSAEEIAQEAFIKLAKMKNKPEVGKEDAWLRSVVLNMARSKWRRQRLGREREKLRFFLSQTKNSIAPMPDRTVALQELRKLPARQKEVLLLRYYCDLTEKQTAETLKISVGSVKTHARRGLQKLRYPLEQINE